MSTLNSIARDKPAPTFVRTPITVRMARRFYRQHWEGALPACMHWYYVEGLQVVPLMPDAHYLIAGATGLYGIVGFRGQGR